MNDRGSRPASPAPPRRFRLFHLLAPGILVAATGVGAGDLITASLAGSQVGMAIVWAVVVGAIFKWTLNEGLARWQMATGTTLLEGWNARLGAWVQWVFVVYLMLWTFCTGAALISACGVAGAALWSFGLPLAEAKVYWGILHSLAGLALVWVGGFRLFEKIMSVCIALMFCTVMTTAVLIRPDWSAIGRGLIMPSIPAGSLPWILGVLGGVGGSVTLLSYGYWVREVGRSGRAGVRQCRIDLGVGYTMTALFGVAMLTIGSRLVLSKESSDHVAVALADQLAGVMGPAGKWIFLIGFWGAVFSSLLGVWQSIPYLFADFVTGMPAMCSVRGEGAGGHGPSSRSTKSRGDLIRRGLTSAARREVDFTKSTPYRVYLIVLAIVPMVMLRWELQQVQLAYAVMAAIFMPLLALTLLILNNRRDWIGPNFRSPLLLNALLAATLAFFAWTGLRELTARLGQPPTPAPAPATSPSS